MGVGFEDQRWETFKKALIQCWPAIPIHDIETADLVFSYCVNRDSLEEFLNEVGETLSVYFRIDLNDHYPGWFSPYLFLKTRKRGGLLDRIRRKIYPKLTPKVIWETTQPLP